MVATDRSLRDPAEDGRTSRRSRRLAAPLLAAGAVGALTLALHVRDPHRPASWGGCPFKLVTGLDCPGCGGLRAVHDLTNLDVLGAASSNLLFVVSIPLLVALWVSWLLLAWRGSGRLVAVSHPQRWGALAIVLVVAFAVLRNLPVGGWLAA